MSIALLGLVLLAAPSAPSLDGQTFEVVVVEDSGKRTPHTLVFKGGNMSSPECSAWGFEAGSYFLKVDGKTKTFEATLASSGEGKLLWRGRVEGGAVKGSSVWTKKGQKPIHYRFEGRRRGQKS